MTKEQFFQERISQLSRRAKYVIDEQKISCDTLYYCKKKDFMRLPNCGPGTVKELMQLADDIRREFPDEVPYAIKQQAGIDPNVDDSKQNESTLVFEGHRISVRAKYALDIAGIENYASLKDVSKTGFVSLKKYRGIGKLTIREIKDLYEKLSSDRDPYSIPIDTLEERYFARKSETLDALLVLRYNQQISLLDNNSKSLINKHFPSVIDIIRNKDITIPELFCDISERQNIHSTIYNFKQEFIEYTNLLLTLDDSTLQWNALLYNSHFLNDNDRNFIFQFFQNNGYYPMFFLLYKSIKGSKDKHIQIFAKHIGLYKKKYSIRAIAKAFDMTYQNVNIILDKFACTDLSQMTLGCSSEMWKQYTFLNNEYLTPDNTEFHKISSQEKLPFDFFSFCQLCCSVSGKHKPLCIGIKDDHTICSCRGNIKKSEIYGINMATASFDYISAIKSIQHRYSSSNRTADEFITITELCSDERYWEGKVPHEFVLYCVHFLTHFLENTLHISVEGDSILLPATRLDIRKFIYCYLQKKQEASSLDEIYAALKKAHPEIKYTTSDQIRPFVADKELFRVIGRKSLYTIVEDVVYDGSQAELIIDILKTSIAPVERSKLIKKALLLRPDSKASSIRTIIGGLVKDGVLELHPHRCIGLKGRRYPTISPHL